MALGRRKSQRQESMWVATTSITAPGHPFYQALNKVLAKHDFDRFVEQQCAKFYAGQVGRPSTAPGIYFRMLLVGYFEGIGSERGIDWRCSDSLSLHDFLGIPMGEGTPDHSTISRTRRLIDVETHQAVFTWVLTRLAEQDLLCGKTLGIDSTTLEANAAMRSIVRRDTKQSYEEFLTELAKASGIKTPTREDLARLDRDRPGKGSNKEWEHPHDPDARITKMKDGSTHLAHKLEQAVDMKTGAVVGVTVQHADQGDTKTLPHTIEAAAEQFRALSDDPKASRHVHQAMASEAVLDKGYFSEATLSDLDDMEIRTYIAEPRLAKGKRRRFKGKDRERRLLLANRRRIKGQRGRSLMRRRGELLERPFAHELQTGGLRRTHVRGHDNVLKRMLMGAAATNIGLLMRQLFAVGTPRTLQGHAPAALAISMTVLSALRTLGTRHERLRTKLVHIRSRIMQIIARCNCEIVGRRKLAFATGC